MENTKVLILAKKLYELSKRGIGGEKENAIRMLDKVMKEHGISFEDIESEIKKQRDFRYYSNKEKKFLVQVISSVIGKRFGANHGDLFRGGKKLYKYTVELTDAQFIEVLEKHRFFWKEFQEAQDLFYSAFIQKQKLYSKPEEKVDDEEDEKEMTPEEKAKMWKMIQMMGGIKKKSITKQIEGR